MAHIFVIPGHGAGDPGACAHGFSEAERVRALATRIAQLGGENVSLGSFDRNYYADGGVSALGIPADWQVVELHMDSADSGARGGHVIIQEGFEPDAYDTALANFVSEMFPGRSQAIVGRSDLANPSRAAQAGYPYRLLENCFISNRDDLAKFNSKLDDVARGILAAFGVSIAAPEPAKPTEWDGPGTQLAGDDATSTCAAVADYACTKAEHTLIAKSYSHHDAVAGLWRAGQLKARVAFNEQLLTFDGYITAGYNAFGTQRFFAMAQRDVFGADLGSTCIVCNPDSYQDAAGAGSVSYANGWPVVYYEGHANFHEQLGWYERVVVVGGIAAVPELDRETTRWAGATADATMVEVAEHGFADWPAVAIANGSPDSVAACMLGMPVLPAYASETLDALKRKRPKRIVWVGGLGAIDYDRRTVLCKAAGLL